MLEELSNPPRDLVFLQEMNVQPDGEKGQDYIPYNKVPYQVYYTQEQTGNKHTVILYNTKKFKELDFKEVLLEAYYSLQWQVDCYEEWQELVMVRDKTQDMWKGKDKEQQQLVKEIWDAIDIQGDPDVLNPTFESKKDREQFEKNKKQLDEEIIQLGSKHELIMKQMTSLQQTLEVADNPTWEKLKKYVADKHTKDNINKGVQYITGSKSSDTTHKIRAQKTIEHITCNRDFLSLKSDIQVLANCLLRESRRKNKKEKEVRGSDFWTGILKDVTYRFALTCLTY
jgi:hypothetical protein